LDRKLVDYPLVGALGTAMARIYATVPARQVLPLLFDDVVSSPQAVWRQLTAFLGLDDEFQPEFSRENASNRAHRFPTLRRLTHRPPRAVAPAVDLARRWSAQTNLRTVENVKSRLWRAEDRPAASRETMEAVTDFFRDDVKDLAGLTGKDLLSWL
jgi:hypothetical protein